jgi:hypothetical protein
MRQCVAVDPGTWIGTPSHQRKENATEKKTEEAKKKKKPCLEKSS